MPRKHTYSIDYYTFYNQKNGIDYLIRCGTEKESGSLVHSIEIRNTVLFRDL